VRLLDDFGLRKLAKSVSGTKFNGYQRSELSWNPRHDDISIFKVVPSSHVNPIRFDPVRRLGEWKEEA